MTRTRLSLALGLTLFAAGCPAETPTTTTAPGENLGSPEAGSTKKVGAPVTTPPAAPADAPAAAPPADKPADAPAAAPAAPPAEAPKNP